MLLVRESRKVNSALLIPNPSIKVFVYVFRLV